MAINFGNLDATAPAPTEVAPATAGVVLNLEKNTILSMKDSIFSLRTRNKLLTLKVGSTIILYTRKKT